MLSKRPKLILFLAAALSVGGYLLASYLKIGVGFPLDDAWIHQTYARNLVQWGEWAFWRGQVSGGSTAPLWSALLALGYWLKIPFFVWTFGLGILLLWGLALFADSFIGEIFSEARSSFPWAGLFIVGEWHLVWAAASGMETLLYALIVTGVLVLLAIGKRNFLLLGLLVGLSVWVRPGGVTLLGPVVVAALFSGQPLKKIMRDLVGLGLSFGTILSFYLLFNLYLTGTPLPNTFYAKQAEYAILRELAPLWMRFLGEIKLPLIGAGIVLLPGALFYVWQALRRRDIGILVGMLWFLGYVGIYAWNLPVSYQHGRYMMPAMPIFFLWGLAGTQMLFAKFSSHTFGKKMVLAWQVALFFIWLAFLGIGAKSYAEDVIFIENEMVTTAKWVAGNIPPEQLIAAHDIGALGYFDGRPLVDLAGLVSPEVIPFIRDEQQLAYYLDKHSVEFLIVFPTWYETLPEGLPIVYNTQNSFTLSIGGENMVIYQWIK